MKVMIKFDMEVLKQSTYGGLKYLDEKLTKALEISNSFKEFHRRRGEITKAAETEASAIRISENIDTVRLAMFLKESEALESFKFGIEPLSLN